MRQAELNNWSLEPTQIADLCSSINQFFARTGVIPPLGAVQPPVCHGSMHPAKPSQHLNTGEPPSPLFLFSILSQSLEFCRSREILRIPDMRNGRSNYELLLCFCVDDFSLILSVSKDKHTGTLCDESSSFTFPPV